MPSADADRLAIATRLRLARNQAGLSQGQVGSQLGLQRPSVSEIEAGRRRVTAEELARMAGLYGVSMDWLANGETGEEDPQIELAARELTKLRKEDLAAILRLLKTLRRRGERK